jgi:hypothetical protein
LPKDTKDTAKDTKIGQRYKDTKTQTYREHWCTKILKMAKR